MEDVENDEVQEISEEQDNVQAVLSRFQNIIVNGDREAAKAFRLETILPPSITEDIFGTLAYGTDSTRIPSDEETIIDPNELLVAAVEEAIIEGRDLLQIVGLALKNGGNPNTYVTVNIIGEEGEPTITIVHIIAYAWRLCIERNGDYRVMLDVVAMLCAKGADSRLPVIDRDILLERKRKTSGPFTVSSAEVMWEAGVPKSVLAYIAESREATFDAEEDGRSAGTDETYYMSDMTLKYIAVFTAFRDTLGDVPDVVREDFFTAGDLRLTVPISNDDHDKVTALAVVIGEFLDDVNHMVGNEGDLKLAYCMSIHAHKCSKLLLESGRISELGAEEAYLQAIDSYNYTGVRMMIEYGFRPRYNHIDRVIFAAANKESEDLPVSAQIMTGVLVMMGELGLSFDHKQLGMIGSVSKKTFKRLAELERIPYWKRTCEAPHGYVRSDLRALARELDLDPEMDKESLCAEFSRLAEGDEEELDMVSQKLQETKRRADKTSLGDLAAERKNSKSIPSKPIVNEAHLTRPANTYSKLDLHCIRDRSDGQIYCFEAIDYPFIVETKKNPITKTKITQADFEAVSAKYRTLTSLNLPLASIGIEKAIAKLRHGTSREDYELWVRARRDRFLYIISEPEVEIDKDLFTEIPEDGGLEISEMEVLIREVCQRDDIYLSPVGDREHALRSFALTFMEYVDAARAEDDGEALDELFARLINGVGALMQPEKE